MQEIIEYQVPKQVQARLPQYGKISLRVSREMLEAIEKLCKDMKINMKPSEFARRSVRKYVRSKNVVDLNKNKNTTKSKLNKWLTVEKWEQRFPKNQKLIRAVIWARIKEEQTKLPPQ